MAHLFEQKDRHVIPNWRSFENTAKLGELNGSSGIELKSTFKPDITDLLNDWSDDEYRTIGVAGDILSVALVGNHELDSRVIEIAEFVLLNEAIAPKALISTAKNILKPSQDKVINLDLGSVELFQDPTNLVILYKKINELKLKLRAYPHNPINWIEIGRLYSIIGQLDKANRAMRNAFFLSSENRFILRNVARFFIHLGEEGREFAHDIIRKSALVQYDPWLLSTEISLATLRDRESRFIKKGLAIIESDSFHPFNITELASSLATVEMKNSNIKKSRKLFEKSLVNPNDNSLAQAEWASQKENNFFSLDSSKMNLVNSYEAKARDFAEKKKWTEAIESSKGWFLDIPFSKGPILFANHIALHKIKDHHKAVEIAKIGLISHPNDSHLINNIVYSLAIQDKVEEAELLLKKVNRSEVSTNSIRNICLLATEGLLNYRKNNPERARTLYLESINLAKELGYNMYSFKALANMAREEILLGQEDVSEVINRLKDFLKKSDDEDLNDQINEVVDLYNKKEESKNSN